MLGEGVSLSCVASIFRQGPILRTRRLKSYAPMCVVCTFALSRAVAAALPTYET